MACNLYSECVTVLSADLNLQMWSLLLLIPLCNTSVHMYWTVQYSACYVPSLIKTILLFHFVRYTFTDNHNDDDGNAHQCPSSLYYPFFFSLESSTNTQIIRLYRQLIQYMRL